MPEITNAGLIAEARRLASSASPAPWTAIAEGRVEHSPSKPPLWCVLGTEELGDGECSYFNEADARFVAWAREGVLQMADALERTERERDAAVAQVAALREAATRFITAVDNMTLSDFQTQKGLDELGVLRDALASPSPAAERLLEDAKLGRHVREAGQRGLDDVAAGRLTTQEELDMAYSAAERERDEALVREAALREALQDLMDWQNGPPLPSYETGWQEAHDRAQELLASPSPAAERLQDTKTASIDTSNLGEVVGRYKLIPQGEHERLLAQAKAADGLAAAVTVWLEEWGPKPSISFEAGNALRAYRKAKEG